jgi:cysteine desulfurase / selenocysteine lyase
MIETIGHIHTPHAELIEKIRNDFPILKEKMNGKDLVFLDTAASAQKPIDVIEAMSDYYKHSHANVHRGVYQLSQKATEAFEESRRAVKKFIHAAADEEIIFVRGCTEGINLVAQCFGRSEVSEGDEIIISGMEHHSNIVPWQMLCEDRKAILKVIPVKDSGELDMDAFGKMLNDRVKIVAVVHVSNTLGTINPVKEIISQSHDKGIPVLVDGAQAIPHSRVDVQDLDADFYVFSGHKMYGPTGIGVLYGKKDWLEKLPPYQGGGDMIETVSFEKTTYNVPPFKFEAGTPDIAGAIGLHAAIDYIESIGYDFIHEREQALLSYGTALLEKIPGLRIIGKAKEKAGAISFVVEGVHPYDIGALLDKMGIAVRTGHHCTQPLMDRFNVPGTVRASMGIYNTEEELDKLAAGIERAVTMLKS